MGFIARIRGLLGYAALLFLAWGLSTDRRSIAWRPVFWGLALQAVFALIVLQPALSQFFFDAVDLGIRRLLGFAEAGMSFVFQATESHQVTYLGDKGVLVTEMVVGRISPVMKTFAFWVLPTVIFFASLITVLYHLGLMQWIVGGMARAMVHTMKTSGAETLSCTANIILGQTEAPLLIKPFIARMTRSEMMAVMVGGFGTVSGGIMAIYVAFLKDLPGIAGHLMTASIMAAPCSLAIAKILVPERETAETAGVLRLHVERPDSNVIEAAARGASEGMTLVLNIAAMLVAFVGLVALVNALLGLGGLSLQKLLGWGLSPLAWAMGVPWREAGQVGGLLGEKLVLTELLAYLDLKGLLVAGAAALSARSAIISSYALCGFANVASIGIQIGGIGGLAPARRGDLARLGLRAMLGGAIVSCLSGTIAGMLV
jgi:CNT family concentrative nucleoside transporter